MSDEFLSVSFVHFDEDFLTGRVIFVGQEFFIIEDETVSDDTAVAIEEGAVDDGDGAGVELKHIIREETLDEGFGVFADEADNASVRKGNRGLHILKKRNECEFWYKMWRELKHL